MSCVSGKGLTWYRSSASACTQAEWWVWVIWLEYVDSLLAEMKVQEERGRGRWEERWCTSLGVVLTWGWVRPCLEGSLKLRSLGCCLNPLIWVELLRSTGWFGDCAKQRHLNRNGCKGGGRELREGYHLPKFGAQLVSFQVPSGAVLLGHMHKIHKLLVKETSWNSPDASQGPTNNTGDRNLRLPTRTCCKF